MEEKEKIGSIKEGQEITFYQVVGLPAGSQERYELAKVLVARMFYFHWRELAWSYANIFGLSKEDILEAEDVAKNKEYWKPEDRATIKKSFLDKMLAIKVLGEAEKEEGA